jgi:hypothetical protein
MTKHEMTAISRPLVGLTVISHSGLVIFFVIRASSFVIRMLAAVAALAGAAGLLSGCGPSAASVFGEVTYDGKPVEDGYITFTPADGKGKDAGGPIASGRYRITELPPGPKVVKVIGVKKVNFASTSDEMMRKADEARKAGNYSGLVDPADTIPENAQGNNAQIDLKVGENLHDFHLKKPAKRSGER